VLTLQNHICMNLLVLLAILALCTAQQHTLTCGASSCSSCLCSNGTCPELVPNHIAVYFNLSAFTLSYEFESSAASPPDTMSAFLLRSDQYARYLANQSFSYYSSSRLGVSGTCMQPFLETKGRGAVLVFRCDNADRDCLLWYKAYSISVLRYTCNSGCSIGMVGDGNCDPACNASNCEFDGSDCLPPPPPPLPPAPPTTTAPSCPFSCLPSWIGDGECDNACYSAACNFDGGDCENPCSPNPCLNGGGCRVSQFNGWKCDCPLGYCGETCASREMLNANSESDNSWCQNHYLSCGVSYEHASFYFCCEYKSTGANYTCRLETVSGQSKISGLLALILSLAV
jgi:hypothetical protein